MKRRTFRRITGMDVLGFTGSMRERFRAAFSAILFPYQQDFINAQDVITPSWRGTRTW